MSRTDARRWALALVVTGSAVLLGCVSTEPPDRTPAPWLAEDFAAMAPAEVALLPVPPAPNVGDEEGRTAVETAYRELLERRYTPLSPEWVARRLAERGLDPPYELAALRAALGADAYLEVTIDRFVRVPTLDPPRVEIEGRASLLDGKTGRVLFQQRLAASYESDGRPALEHLARHVRRLLLELPARGAP